MKNSIAFLALSLLLVGAGCTAATNTRIDTSDAADGRSSGESERRMNDGTGQVDDTADSDGDGTVDDEATDGHTSTTGGDASAEAELEADMAEIQSLFNDVNADSYEPAQ